MCVGEKGQGSEANRLLHDFAFDKLGLRKIVCHSYADNSRAIRFHEKVGYVFVRDEVRNGREIKWFELTSGRYESLRG